MECLFSSSSWLQKHIHRLSQEQQQLTDRLKEEASEKDQLKRMRSELEKERWQLDKTIEQLHKEVRAGGD